MENITLNFLHIYMHKNILNDIKKVPFVKSTENKYKPILLSAEHVLNNTNTNVRYYLLYEDIHLLIYQ